MATDSPKQLGMIGLGRMGANIVRRIMRDGHSAVVYDTDPAAVADLVKDGAIGANSIAEFVELDRPRNAWIMVPVNKITDAVIKKLPTLLKATQSSMVVTPTTATIFATRRLWPKRAFTSSTVERPAESGDSSAATA